MPVSTTPTTTSFDPVVTSQASRALMSAPATPPDPPVLLSPHRLPNCGSSGVLSICSTKSGSRYEKPGSSETAWITWLKSSAGGVSMRNNPEAPRWVSTVIWSATPSD